VADGGAPGRVPPANLDAEGAVLSACLLDDTKAALDTARGVLGAGRDFYADANRRIWEAILAVDAAGQPVDIVLVAQRLRDTNRLAQVGGPAYLAQLSDATPAIANVEAHAKIIADLGRQRRLIATYQRLAAEGYEPQQDVNRWAQNGAQAISDIVAEGITADPPETFAELVPAALEESSKRARHGAIVAGVDTGWNAYTKVLGGWVRGKEHIVAARPGMGKTSFLLGSCINIAQQGLGVVFASAEMTKQELAVRALAVAANVNTKAVKTGRMNRDEWAAVTNAAERLRALPISIAYCPGATVGQIRGIFRTERQKLISSGRCSELGLGAVDYIQILDGERQKGDSREAEVAGISKRLAWLAAEFSIPLVVASQLSRECEKRPNKRPQLSDLRESGAIEQDAYSVTFLYRDEYYDKGSTWAGTVEAIVAKNRDGETGTARMAFIAESTRIANLPEDEQQRLGYDDNDY
jgi:replicative DNA helicase